MPLEIACFNVPSAKTALDAGADRIELCGNRYVGGSAPSRYELSEFVAYRASHERSDVPIHVMLRPRGGSFVYNDADFGTLKGIIPAYASLGADGFVFGILTPTGEVDLERCCELVLLAGKPCTFHRAFDTIEDKYAALEDIIACGFSAILTSGGGTDVVAGKQELVRLVRAAQSRIEIIPGGGLRSTNLALVRSQVHATWWHSSADIDGVGMADEEEIGDLKRALERPFMNGGN